MDKQHQQAEKLREQGQFYQALNLYQQVITQYLEKGEAAQTVGPLQGQALTYKNLYKLTTQTALLDLALGLIETSLKLAQRFELKLEQEIGAGLKGEVFHLKGDLNQAKKWYQQAAELRSEQDALRGRYLYHLGAVEYQLGKKEQGRADLEQGLALIRNNQDQFDRYTLDVWESGVLIELVKALKSDQPEAAKRYLQQARRIVDANPELKLREREVGELESK
ncbi:MAG: hypothetical protein GF381_02000 [Candidatus Pacebacteria bacterium]|nr:hypothetical protein [Candidatus Paceibacterota bacterium]